MLSKWWVVVIEFYLIFTMRARSYYHFDPKKVSTQHVLM